MVTAAHPTNFSEKKHKKTNNGISFWAFLPSIFIYISIFYIFNLSPLNLLSSTRFWFFISNTLILIIAADFGAFFSQSDIYQDYLKMAAKTPSFECYMQRRNSVDDRKRTQEIAIPQIPPPEEIKCVIDEHEIVAKEMETVTKECDSFDGEGKKSEVKLCGRSRSEVGIVLAENEEKKGLQRSLSETERYNLKNVEEENNEFSDMSVEELNRRVEEFIQRFNRQIRLQAASRKLQNY